MNLLRRNLLVLLAALLALPTFSQGEEQPELFTLEECVAYAQENYQGVQTTALDVAKAQARIKEIWADGLPQVNGNLNYTYNPQIQVQALPDFISPSVYGVLAQERLIDPSGIPSEFGIVPAQFGVAHNVQGAITLRQLIFDGTFFLGLKAAKVYSELSDKELEQAKIDVAANVTKAYYAVLINQERLNLALANTIRLDTLLRQTVAMYENGFSEKIDADRIKVSFNNAKTLKDNIERSIQMSKLALKFQMGMPIDQPLELADKLADSENLIKENVALEEGNAPENRIEYSILDTQRQLAELDKKRIGTMYYPNVYFNATYGANTFGNSLGEMGELNPFSNLGISIGIPIFDGLRKKYQIEQKKIEVRQVELAQSQLANSITLEQSQSMIQLQNALETLEAQQSNMELSQEIFRITKIKYQEGVGSVLEVTDAEAAYKEAENNYYASLYDAIVAKVDYERANGTLVE